MTPRRDRATRFLLGSAKLVALVLVAGGIGAALGTGLSTLSTGDEPAPLEDAAGTVTDFAGAGTTATARPPTTAPGDPPAQVAVTVLDARLFTDDSPSGRDEQRARLTVRIRAENAGSTPLTLPPAVLRVGSVRVPADGAGARLHPLPAEARQTITLRFMLAGEATPKVVRDRRARILVAGHSLPMRIKLRAPAT